MEVFKVHIPVVGTWRVKLIMDGPWVPVRIWDEAERGEDGELLEDENLHLVVNGEEKELTENWAQRLNLSDEPISEVDYAYYLKLNAWAAEHAPDTAPEAKPKTPIDVHKIPPIEP